MCACWPHMQRCVCCAAGRAASLMHTASGAVLLTRHVFASIHSSSIWLRVCTLATPGSCWAMTVTASLCRLYVMQTSAVSLAHASSADTCSILWRGLTLAASWCLMHPCTLPSLTTTAFLLSLRSWLSLSVCSYLGEALRALLVLEMRSLTVHNQQATERVPAHLPQGCTAVRCNVRSASGGHATVVLGGPPDGELKRVGGQ